MRLVKQTASRTACGIATSGSRHTTPSSTVNRLTAAIGAFSGPFDATTKAEALSDVKDVLDRTVDAFNRVELVCSPELYALAVKILEAANAEQLRQPGQVPVVLQAIGVASRNYREAAKAELRA